MPIRLAVRAVLLHHGRLLVVNAYPGRRHDLWCAPGGGAEPHQSLPDNLIREVYEETGLTVAVGAPVLVNEFHAPDRNFHQVDLFFRCTVDAGDLAEDWCDPEGVVTDRRWVTEGELADLPHRPRALARAAWSPAAPVLYDPLEPLIR